MLLATYALLTLTIEQKCERASIRHLQDLLAQRRGFGMNSIMRH